MPASLLYIIWDPSAEIFSIGPLSIRWYGLLFALGFLIGQQILIYIFKKEGKPEQDVETLTVYMVLATVVGARLGHCLFYEPDVYLNDPIRILKIWEGGLASHGATIGILFALWLYARKKRGQGQSYFWVVDRIVITVALAGGLIRMGNLMNSEIIGKPTDVPWGFVFARSAEEELQAYNENYIEYTEAGKGAGEDTVINNQPYTSVALHSTFKKGAGDEKAAKELASTTFPISLYQSRGESKEHILLAPNRLAPSVQRENQQLTAAFHVLGKPRHPSQLYEALSCFVLFAFLFWYWNRLKARTPEGSLLGIFLIYVFGLRFLYEFLKENQVKFEDNLALNMGQWLSIPAVLGGILVLVIAQRNARRKVDPIKA